MTTSFPGVSVPGLPAAPSARRARRFPHAAPTVTADLVCAAVVLAFGLGLGLASTPAHADSRLAATTAAVPVFGNVDAYTPPIYEVDDGRYACWQPVGLGNYETHLAQQLANVPLPCYIQPARGTDGEVVVIDRSRGEPWLFEGWEMRWQNQWMITWGGYEPASRFNQTAWGWLWPAQNQKEYGVQASGFAFVPGVITVAELANGVIPHAIHLTVPYACNTFVAPATRTDGNAVATGTQDCYQYGTAYKLPASFSIPANWPRAVRAIAVAARDHGLVITDQNHYGIGFRFENYVRPWAWWSPTGAVIDPYRDLDGPSLNLFECPQGQPWGACFPRENALFNALRQVAPGNTQTFWEALVQVNP